MSSPLTQPALAHLVEFTEASAYADMFRAAPPAFDLQVEESDDCVAFFAPSVDILLFNRVMGLGLRTSARPGVTGSLVERYITHGVRNFGFQLSPEAAPSSLPDELAASDLHIRDYWTKVYRPREPVASIPTDLRIDRIDVSQADIFAEVACLGFGMPNSLKPLMAATVGRTGWHHYMACDDSGPAAVGALFVRDGVGWLGVATTLPDYRRRGAQGAIMSRRLVDGMELGCKWFVTETGKDLPDKPNPSFHNMMHTGFIVAYDRPNYMRPRAQT